jgi:hypothetical protein
MQETLSTETALVISPEQAMSEVQGWLNYKRVDPVTMQQNFMYVQELAKFVCTGVIVINKDFTITHTLKFPVMLKDGGIAFDKLIYKARVTAMELLDMGQLGYETANGKLITTGSILSGKTLAEIGKLDSTDLHVIDALSVFF